MSDEKKLTAKQEAFCLAMLETGSASAAYRKAYSAAKMAETTVHREASVLMDNPKITARIAALRAEAAAKATLTEAWVLDRLMRNVEVSLGDRKVAITYRPKAQDGKEAPPITVEVTERDAHAANRALELLGKKLGIFTDKHELSGPGGGPIETEERTPIDWARRMLFFIKSLGDALDGGKPRYGGKHMFNDDQVSALREMLGKDRERDRRERQERQERGPAPRGTHHTHSMMTQRRPQPAPEPEPEEALAAPDPPAPPPTAKPPNPYEAILPRRPGAVAPGAPGSVAQAQASALDAAADFERTIARDIAAQKFRR